MATRNQQYAVLRNEKSQLEERNMQCANKKAEGTTKTEPVIKKAWGLLNRLSSGKAVDVDFLSCCFGERKRTELLLSYILLICSVCK